jgi:hypothetical protein
MYHTIAFADDLLLHAGRCPRHGRERLLIPRGTPLRARLRPYVVETAGGPVEVADLHFEDGRVTHMARFADFAFVE